MRWLRWSPPARLRPTVIRAATINAAAALGLSDSVGTIAPHMSADIITVAGDPLFSVGALSSVRFVMSRGRVVKR